MNKKQNSWTILTYIAAHNDLEDWGALSLDQVLSAGSSAQVTLAVLYDRPGGAVRCVAPRPGQPVVSDELADFDSGDPVALLDTASWAFTRYPAEHYALVLCSHGSGWQPEEIEQVARQARGDNAVTGAEAVERTGQAACAPLFRSTLANILRHNRPAERAVCFDDSSGRSLDTLELERVARGLRSITGQPLDVLGMDACAMATVEVAYQLRHHVCCLVASEEMGPASGWPYRAIFGALCERPGQSARDLAANIVQHYTEYYRAHPPGFNNGDVTKIALDLSQLGPLAEALNALAAALLAGMEQEVAALWAAQRMTQEKETQWGRRWLSKFDFHLWDLRTFAAHLAQASENEAVKQAAKQVAGAFCPGGAVIAEDHQGSWFDGIGGVSIYAVPPGLQRISPYYAELALAKETGWEKMLREYHRQVTKPHPPAPSPISRRACDIREGES